MCVESSVWWVKKKGARAVLCGIPHAADSHVGHTALYLHTLVGEVVHHLCCELVVHPCELAPLKHGLYGIVYLPFPSDHWVHVS